MKQLLTFSITALFALSVNANDFEQKRDKLMADKTINEGVKKELKDYFDKSETIYKECKTKRQDLNSKLSPEARDAKAKYFKRKKREQTTDQQTVQGSATPQTNAKK